MKELHCSEAFGVKLVHIDARKLVGIDHHQELPLLPTPCVEINVIEGLRIHERKELHGSTEERSKGRATRIRIDPLERSAYPMKVGVQLRLYNWALNRKESTQHNVLSAFDRPVPAPHSERQEDTSIREGYRARRQKVARVHAKAQ
jgi:hypothetical protein